MIILTEIYIQVQCISLYFELKIIWIGINNQSSFSIIYTKKIQIRLNKKTQIEHIVKVELVNLEETFPENV